MSNETASGAKGASDAHEEPVLIIQSCPGQVFEVTKSVLEVFPRQQLENIYSTLMRTMSDALSKFEEAEHRMKDAMLCTNLSISQRASSVSELEGVMHSKHRVLENVVKDLVPLYCHAFRSHPKETYQMDVQAAASSRGPTGTVLGQDIQAVLKMSSEQWQHAHNSSMRYLSAVKVIIATSIISIMPNRAGSHLCRCSYIYLLPSWDGRTVYSWEDWAFSVKHFCSQTPYVHASQTSINFANQRVVVMYGFNGSFDGDEIYACRLSTLRFSACGAC